MQKYAKGFVCWSRNQVARLRAAVESFENSLGSEYAVVLRFFKDGDAAEVGIGEEEA
jgi:hypothetical protein